MNEPKTTRRMDPSLNPGAAKDLTGFSRYIDYDVVDKNDHKIGTLHSLWVDPNGRPAFLGIKTGWLFGKNHVVPAEAAETNERRRLIRLSFDEDTIRNAPAHEADHVLGVNDERLIYDYYHLGGEAYAGERPRFSPSGLKPTETPPRFAETKMEAPPAPKMEAAPAPPPRRAPEDIYLQLSEEQLIVGKREVDAGGVRLKKIVKTETVSQPVELTHEEIVIERFPAEGKRPTGEAFTGEDIFIPLHKEEAVVEKESRVREEIHASKRKDVEKQEVSSTVRREDVVIEREGMEVKGFRKEERKC